MKLVKTLLWNSARREEGKNQGFITRMNIHAKTIMKILANWILQFINGLIHLEPLGLVQKRTVTSVPVLNEEKKNSMIFTMDATCPHLTHRINTQKVDQREPSELIKKIHPTTGGAIIFNEKTRLKSSHCCSVTYLSRISGKEIQIGKEATMVRCYNC